MIERQAQFPSISVGLVGGGKRMQNVYLPVLRALSGSVRMAGFTRRDKIKGRQTATEIGVPYFETLSQLVASARPDLLIVCVPPDAVARVTIDALIHKVPLLIETPIAENAGQGKILAEAVEKSKAIVGVLEQKPFLPTEQMKKMILDTGMLGKIILVENDFRSYDYHAIAQLRQYLGRDIKPASVNAIERVSEIFLPQKKEVWDFGMITFANEAVAVHTMSSAYKSAPFRSFQSLRIYGEKGSMVNLDAIVLHEEKICPVEVKVDKVGECTKRIIATLPNGKSLFWENNFIDANISDDGVAIAEHIRAMANAILDHSSVLYGIKDALTDLTIVDAMSLSAARDGEKIDLQNGLPSPVLNLFRMRWWRNNFKKLLLSSRK